MVVVGRRPTPQRPTPYAEIFSSWGIGERGALQIFLLENFFQQNFFSSIFVIQVYGSRAGLAALRDRPLPRRGRRVSTSCPKGAAWPAPQGQQGL